MGKRQCSWKYFLKTNAAEVQVCQEFFLCTFAISHSRLETLRKKLNKDGQLESTPAHKPATTVPEAMLDNVRQHIESFPAVESHYCRANNKETIPGYESISAENVRMKDACRQLSLCQRVEIHCITRFSLMSTTLGFTSQWVIAVTSAQNLRQYHPICVHPSRLQ